MKDCVDEEGFDSPASERGEVDEAQDEAKPRYDERPVTLKEGGKAKLRRRTRMLARTRTRGTRRAIPRSDLSAYPDKGEVREDSAADSADEIADAVERDEEGGLGLVDGTGGSGGGSGQRQRRQHLPGGDHRRRRQVKRQYVNDEFEVFEDAAVEAEAADKRPALRRRPQSRRLLPMLFRFAGFLRSAPRVVVFDRPIERADETNVQHESAEDEERPAEAVFLEEKRPEGRQGDAAAAGAGHGQAHRRAASGLEVGADGDQTAGVGNAQTHAHRQPERHVQQLHRLAEKGGTMRPVITSRHMQ